MFPQDWRFFFFFFAFMATVLLINEVFVLLYIAGAVVGLWFELIHHPSHLEGIQINDHLIIDSYRTHLQQ